MSLRHPRERRTRERHEPIEPDLSIRQVGERIVVCVSGELDAAMAPRLGKVLCSAVAMELPVVLDVAAVTYIDSAVLRLIEGLHPHGLSVTRGNRFVDRLVERTGRHCLYGDAQDRASSWLP